MRTPLKRIPVALPIMRGSRVELTIKDRYLECVRVGQTATVVQVFKDVVDLILDCGHPYRAPLSGVIHSPTQRCTWCRRVVPVGDCKPVAYAMGVSHREALLPTCSICRGEVKAEPKIVAKGQPDPAPTARVGRKLRRLLKRRTA